MISNCPGCKQPIEQQGCLETIVVPLFDIASRPWHLDCARREFGEGVMVMRFRTPLF